MLLALISFELRRRLKMLSTYIYALILSGIGLFLMLAASGVFKSLSTSNGSERIHSNSPVAVFENMTITALFGLFTVAAVFGQAATQDFTFGTWSIIFTRKLKKSTYVLGRFLGAFLFSGVLFAGIGAGQFLGALIAQLIDPAHLGAHRLDVYAWAYFTGVLPMLFLAGSLFFTLAALTRQMAPVYVGVVVLVLGYLVLSTALADVQYRDLATSSIDT
jgi:ABC-2 type transport system permease protein